MKKNAVKVKLSLLSSENLQGWLFVLPVMIPLLMFWIFPVVNSFLISFTDWDLISNHFNIVFFKNYRSLFRDPKFYQVLRNSLVFAVGTTIPTILLGFLVALLFTEKMPIYGFFRTIIFSPYVTPMVAVSIVWSWIFEPRVGILNFVLSLLHLPILKWTQSMDTAMLSVIIVTVWKQLGWAMIFYVEAVSRVPRVLLEAAIIDGAGPLRRLLRLTVPFISPTTYFLVIICTINSLQAYDQILVLTRGGPAGATRTLLYYYFQEAFENFSAGKASAVAVFIVAITVMFSLAETALSKNTVHYD